MTDLNGGKAISESILFCGAKMRYFSCRKKGTFLSCVASCGCCCEVGNMLLQEYLSTALLLESDDLPLVASRYGHSLGRTISEGGKERAQKSRKAF